MNDAIKFNGDAETLSLVLFCLRCSDSAKRLGDPRAQAFRERAEMIAQGMVA